MLAYVCVPDYKRRRQISPRAIFRYYQSPNRVVIQSPGAIGRKVTEIQGSEHAAKTLIVVNCQHITDINHNVQLCRENSAFFTDFRGNTSFLLGENSFDPSCFIFEEHLLPFRGLLTRDLFRNMGWSLRRFDYLERDETNQYNKHENRWPLLSHMHISTSACCSGSL